MLLVTERTVTITQPAAPILLGIDLEHHTEYQFRVRPALVLVTAQSGDIFADGITGLISHYRTSCSGNVTSNYACMSCDFCCVPFTNVVGDSAVHDRMEMFAVFCIVTT